MLTKLLINKQFLKHYAAKCDFLEFGSLPNDFWTFLKCPKNISTY